jgi:hypothetical protein
MKIILFIPPRISHLAHVAASDTQPEPEPTKKMKSLIQIKKVIATNREAGNYLFENLESCEIGKYNGWIMFGDDDEAFPSQAEWSLIVD